MMVSLVTYRGASAEPKPQVKTFPSVAHAQSFCKALGDLDEVIQVKTAESLLDLPDKVLLELYNRCKKTPSAQMWPGSRKAAAKAVFRLLHHLAQENQMGTPVNKPVAAKPVVKFPVQPAKGPVKGAVAPKAPAAAPVVEAEGESMDNETRHARIEAIGVELADAETSYKGFVAERKAELKTLRAQKAPKVKTERKPSEVVENCVQLMEAEGGATKDELATATGAKPGYVTALISRILPERGFKIEAIEVEGQRAKKYHVAERPAAK